MCLSLTFLTVRSGTSLNSFSRCASRWFFPWLTPSLTFFSGCSRRGIFSQVAPVADCVPGCACRWLFSMSHESVADFFFRLCTSLNCFPDRARRWYFLPARTNPSLTSLSMCARRSMCQSLIFSQVKPVADFFFKLRPSRNFFTGRACRCLCPRLCMSLTFIPDRARRWYFLPARTNPSLTSLSMCAHRWLFPRTPPSLSFFQVAPVRRLLLFQLAPVADFFHRPRPSLIFSQVAHVADFFASLHKANADFFFRLHPSLSFSKCACRYFFWQFARARRWMLFQDVPVVGFFPG